MITSRQQNYSTRSKYSDWKFIIWNGGKDKISESNGNKYERHPGRN